MNVKWTKAKKKAETRPEGVPALTAKAVLREVTEAMTAYDFAWDVEGWTISAESDNPDHLDEAAGVYFIVERVRSKEHPRGIWIARYIGQSQDVRREAKKQRICRIVGGCEGKVKFFALYTPGAEKMDRREVEWAMHGVFKPTISTATRPRRKK